MPEAYPFSSVRITGIISDTDQHLGDTFVAHVGSYEANKIVYTDMVKRKPEDGDNTIKSIVGKPRWGLDVREVMKAASELSSAFKGTAVSFEYNDIPVIVTSKDDIEAVYALYQEKYDEKNPPYQPDAAEINHRKNLLAAQAIIDSTELKLRNPGLWRDTIAQRLGDVGDVVLHAERWGKLMQHEIEVNGKPISEIANSTENLAGNLSDFASQMARGLLIQTWQYGDELKQFSVSSPSVTSENNIHATGPNVGNPAIKTLPAANKTSFS